MHARLAACLRQAREFLWGTRCKAAWQVLALRAARTLAVLVRDATRGQLTLRAMSLVYTTLLSLVPLLALSFSVLKAFGVRNQIEPLLLRVLVPLGEGSAVVTERIVAFIENLNVRVLGSLGLAMLIFTSVSLLQKVEESFNFIWHIARPRGFGERFSRYLSVLLVGPILVVTAMGITASVMNAALVRELLAHEPFGHIYYGLSRLMPYVLIVGAFSFVYYFIPNTRVDPAAALLGGTVGGIAWQTAGWAFARFVVSSGSYTAIYSGFAILILFMSWLYLSWLILLLGASVAFYCQHPEYLVAQAGEPRLSDRMRERLALGIMFRVADAFLAGRPPPGLDDLARGLGMPGHAVGTVVAALERDGLLARSGETLSAYLPTRDLGRMSLAQVLDCVRWSGEERTLTPADLPLPPQVEAILQRLDQSVGRTLAGLTVKDLAKAMPMPESRQESGAGRAEA